MLSPEDSEMEIIIVLIIMTRIIADANNTMYPDSAEYLGSCSSERLSNWSKVTQLTRDS